MLSELVNHFLTTSTWYYSFFYIFAMFASVLVAAILRKKFINIIFVLPICTFIVITFNPITAKLLQKTGVIDSGIFYRITWVFPVAIVIAFVLTYCITKIKNKALVVLLVAAACIGLTFLGNAEMSKSTYSKANNIYKTSDYIIAASEAIHEDFGEGRPMLLYGYYFILEYMPYDSDVYAFIGRNELWNYNEKDAEKALENGDARIIFNYVVLNNNIDFISSEEIGKLLDENKIDYIVVDCSQEIEEYYLNAGLRSIGIFGPFEIYRNEY